MTPLELTLTVFGVMMGFTIPILLFVVVIVWVVHKWG